MKKIKYLLIAMIMFVVPLVVLAKTPIEGTDITDIKIPENWKLFTNENIDEMMDWLGFDSTQKLNYKYSWTTNSYYFDLVNEEKTTEIIMIKKISSSSIDDLSIYPDEDIIKSFKEIEKEYEEYDPKVSLYTTSSGVKYYKIEYKSEKTNLNIIDYITKIHGNMYQYKVQSNLELSKDLVNNLESIIGSIEYDNYLEFIKNNAITNEPKKSNNAPIIIIIIIIIVGGGVGAYIFLNKKKNSKNNNTTNVTVAPSTPQTNPSNPAVADFMSPNNSNAIEQKNIDLGQSNGENQK